MDAAVVEFVQGQRPDALSTLISEVDLDHLPAYLETPNPAAVPLHERHGFVVSGRAQAGTCPPIVSMIRATR